MTLRSPFAIAASLALALAGCTIIPAPDSQVPMPPAPSASPDGAPLTYAALGQTVRVEGPAVTPLKVLEDSRCPANARCVWAGQVRLRVRAATGTRHRDLELTSGKPVPVADGTLELVDVRPDKFTGADNGTVEPGAYRFGFRFTGGL